MRRALIGRGWLTATDKTGHYCLENPDDFVRIEIASGLVQGKRVIPVLVDDATIPRANELPDEMMPLARRQAVRITHERFKDDVERLVRVLEKALAEAGALRKAAKSPEPPHGGFFTDAKKRMYNPTGIASTPGHIGWG